MPRPLLLLLLLASILTCFGCKPPAQASRTPTRSVTAPTGNIVVAQMFDFADGSQTLQGTGFFACTPGGRTVVITSAHYLDFDGPRLKSATWLARDGEKLGTATHSLGRPGDAGVFSGARVDLRSDYLVLHPTQPINTAAAGYTVLELDPRAKPASGERVWLPIDDGFLDESTPPRLVAGTVDGAELGASVVVLDEPIELASLSGSPIISQTTGKVIGTVSRGGESEGKVRLVIAPSSGVLGEINRAEQNKGGLKTIPLEDTIGRRP